MRIEIDPDEKDPSKAVARVKERDEALPPSEDDEGGEDDKRFEQYNKKLSRTIQKRMSRLSKNISRQYDQRIAEIQAEHQREVAALRRERGVDTDRGVDADAAHETEMAALQSQLELAAEKGDSKEVARLTRVMSQKDAQYWAKKQAKVSTVETRRQPAERQPAQREPAADPRLTPQAKQWIQKNREWFDDDDYRVERQAALVIDEDLDDEGYDRETPEYFAELSKRLKSKFPGLEVVGAPAKKNGKANGKRAQGDEGEEEDHDFQPSRAPVMSHEDRGTAPPRQRTKRATLSREQIATMRAMKMDPDNNEDVMTFWEESQALANEESD